MQCYCWPIYYPQVARNIFVIGQKSIDWTLTFYLFICLDQEDKQKQVHQYLYLIGIVNQICHLHIFQGSEFYDIWRNYECGQECFGIYKIPFLESQGPGSNPVWVRGGAVFMDHGQLRVWKVWCGRSIIQKPKKKIALEF